MSFIDALIIVYLLFSALNLVFILIDECGDDSSFYEPWMIAAVERFGLPVMCFVVLIMASIFSLCWPYHTLYDFIFRDEREDEDDIPF